MEELHKLIIILILFIVLLIYDINTKYKTCIKNNFFKIFPIIFLHRLINVFMYTGWIFNNKKILYTYLFFIFLLIIHWITNKNKCILTDLENKICEFPDDTQYDFISKKFGKNVLLYYFFVCCISVGIVIYKLLRK